MYRAIVRKRIRDLFDAVNRGDAEPVLRAFAREFEHSFLGDTALGGSRKTLASTRRWYERLYRLLPDIRFELRRILVSGGPWNTLVLVEWDETNSGADGVRTTNRGVHVAHLEWGRVTRLAICPDQSG
jgi:ketosteroid isomerase-like protein